MSDHLWSAIFSVIVYWCLQLTTMWQNRIFSEIWRFLPRWFRKGQLQRFHKLISSDKIWPSEHGFEVISRFHSFSENNNRETFVCDVRSDQSSMISTERSDLRDFKASGNCCVWWYLEGIMVYCVAYDCLMIVGRPKAFHPTNFKQTTKEGCKP